MNIRATLSGGFPKLPLKPGQPNVRVVRNRVDQGKATERDLADAIRETTRHILRNCQGFVNMGVKNLCRRADVGCAAYQTPI